MKQEQPPFTIPISLDELLMSLLSTDRAEGITLADTLELPPNSTIQYIYSVPALKTKNGKIQLVAIPYEFMIQPDPDGIVSAVFKADETILLNDPSMISSLYATPLNFIRNYALAVYAKKALSMTFTNTSSNETATVAFRAVIGIMREEDFERITYNYSERVKDWLLSKNVG